MKHLTSRSGGTSFAQRAALVCLLLFSISLWIPAGWTAPAPNREVVNSDLEAWYHVFPDSGQEAPALPVTPDPVNPYQANTLHVGVTGGQEESRTYFDLDLDALPTDFVVVGGLLELPIDVSQGSPTQGAANALVQLCLALAMPEKPVEGSFEAPPDIDCDTRSVGNYVEKPYPRVLIDLGPFAESLSFAPGFAVVPTARAKEEAQNWHLTIYGKKNKSEAAHQITAEFTFTEGTEVVVPIEDGLGAGSSGTTGGFTSSGGGVDLGSTTSTSSGPSFGSSTATDTAVGEATPDPAATPIGVAAPTTQELVDELQPSAYTVVWSLPLALLALAFFFGSALTHEAAGRFTSSRR